MYGDHVADKARKVDGIVDGADREGDVSAGEGKTSDEGEEMTESKKPLNYKLTTLSDLANENLIILKFVYVNVISKYCLLVFIYKHILVKDKMVVLKNGV